MSIEQIVITIGFMLISYIVGYKIGWLECFKYLKQKLEEYRNGTV